ncbi:hypothetical protein VUR80DRAFT_4712 [Thermomyces stellatus]
MISPMLPGLSARSLKPFLWASTSASKPRRTPTARPTPRSTSSGSSPTRPSRSTRRTLLARASPARASRA